MSDVDWKVRSFEVMYGKLNANKTCIQLFQKFSNNKNN